MLQFPPEKLASLNKIWAKAKVPVSQTVPGGDYKTIIERAEWKKTDAGHPYISIKCKIIEGDYRGKYVWKNLSFSTNAQAGHAKADIQNLGQDPATLEEIDLDGFLDLSVIINVKTNTKDGIKYSNVYIKGMVKNQDEAPF
ncbi:DUF669 domain-containing protein [Candidatus Riflebacteria bacterium]